MNNTIMPECLNYIIGVTVDGKPVMINKINTEPSWIKDVFESMSKGVARKSNNVLVFEVSK